MNAAVMAAGDEADEAAVASESGSVVGGELSEPVVLFEVVRDGTGLYRYSDGSQDREYTVTKTLFAPPDWFGPSRPKVLSPEYADLPPPPGENPFGYAITGRMTTSEVITEVADSGGVPTHELFRASCVRDGEITETSEYWVLLPTPEAVAEVAGLFAKVTGQLQAPGVEFRDPDLDHGWLWVQVEHHVGITTPAEVYESAKLFNSLGQSAEAFVAAEPVSIEIEMESDAGEKELHRCDIDTATSEQGCKIRFTHASTITDNDLFYGEIRVSWNVTSNSGKYQGLPPFITGRGFEVKVAEAMAVTCPATGCDQ